VADGSVTRCVLGNGARAADLDGRVAVVTGASRGLGAGIAERLVDLGLRIGICARKRPEPPGSDRRQVVTMSADVRDPGDMEAFGSVVAERFGKIDLWVNNAGVVPPIGKLADVDPGMVAHLVSVNVTGVANGSRAFARHVRRRPGDGVLVSITSEAETIHHEGWAAYCASKAAVDRLMEVVAEEERENGLRAYAVVPGAFDPSMRVLNSPAWVADALVELAFATASIESGTVVRVPDETTV
jgi:NAD(P)-dependent dehydrogenase (short-subunit alcohol dehydrogenase family)